ncbi:MAG: allantoinase AllB [Chthoniobacterales bacterium]
MSDFDLVVRAHPNDIGILDGKFAEIGSNLPGSATEEVDAKSLTIFPGVIDSHVHFNEPGRADWEGFTTGSGAAALGGTTTIFDMPLNSHPPTIDGPAFDAKRAAAEQSSFVDFGLWGGLVPNNLDQLPVLRDRGVVGLKAFMCNSGIDDFPYVDLATLKQGMRIAAELDLLVAIHAESQEITEQLTRRKVAAGKTTVADFVESRPVEAELDAIGAAIDLAADTGCRLHIVHVSCGRGVELVADGRSRGVDVTCETCPHYLLLTEQDMVTIGPPAKCAPPLRPGPDHMSLRDRISDITTVGSDHSPSPPEMKRSQNFFEVWGGISSCQHLLSLLHLCGHEGNRIRELTSENVAKRFGIAHKGRIAIGQDADFTLLDPNDPVTVTAEALNYRHKQTPYIGRQLPRVVRTILRGQTIAADGKVSARPIGKLVRPNRS